MQLTQCIGTQEIKLWKDTKDRRNYEDLADLFAIIKVSRYHGEQRLTLLTVILTYTQTTEHLEAAYVRDSITPDEVSHCVLSFCSGVSL